MINFYELRHNLLIKTIPIFEELESIIILQTSHSADIIHAHHNTNNNMTNSTSSSNGSNSGAYEYVVLVGGQYGVLHMLKIHMNVSYIVYIPYICYYIYIIHILAFIF